MSRSNSATEKFYWDNPSTSLHLQTSIPLKIQIGKKIFHTKSWSLSGFRLVNFRADRVDIVGKTFPATLIVNFRNFNISIDTIAAVKEYAPDLQEMEAEFKILKEEHKELLRYFIQAIASGEMTSIDNVIRRVDMPVESPSIKIPTNEVPTRKSLMSMSSLYWLLGLMLLGYLLFSWYSSSYRMEVNSAVVSRKILTVQSAVAGTIKNLAIKTGDSVQPGALLASIVPSPLEHDANNLDGNMQSYDSAIHEVEDLLNVQDKKLSAYRKVAESDVQQARVQFNAAKSRLQLAQNTLTQMQGLFSQGILSALAFKKHQEDLLVEKENMDVARIELSKKQDILDSANDGYLYNGKDVDNEREKLLAKLNKLKKSQQLLQGDMTNDPRQIPGAFAVKAPIKGTLKEWLVDESQYLHVGQNVAKLVDTSENPYIDAFLSQDEVNWVGLKTTALAYIPALDKSFPVSVAYIDRTSGFFEEVNNRFDWRSPEEKTARVRLEFKDYPGEAVTPGLPVVVNFQKNKQSLSSASLGALDFSKGLPGQKPANTVTVSKSSSVATDRAVCNYSLWPASSIISTGSQKRLPSFLLEHLLAKADAALEIVPQALSGLNSAGVVDPKDEALLKTRESLQDSQRSALLAIAYKLTGDEKYFKQAGSILMAWAQTYKPSGHPIDETKLDAMLWAYDLLKCELSADDNNTFQLWLKDIRDKKKNWAFGKSSGVNNWKTNQLKIQLMIDKLLSDQQTWKSDIEATDKHLTVNILKDGSTFDYEERNALHYHVYDLEAWLEIALLEQKYRDETKQAFDFLTNKLNGDDVHNQFVGSKQAIDEKRANAGFEYARRGGDYRPEEAEKAILLYATVNNIPLNQAIPSKDAAVFTEDVFSQSLFAYVRYYLLRPQNEQ
jgi:multidrug resistance efflux pump